MVRPQLTQAKFAIAVAITWITTSAIYGQQAPPAPLKLESMHGTMITMIGDTGGVEFEIWAKGNNLRSELSAGDQKIIVVQLGDTIYTFGPGSKQGNKTRFETGLAAHGLIEQIALVTSKGRKESSKVVDGITYDQYLYDADAPQERALVLLGAKTSLPKDWVSVVKNGDSEPVPARTVFRDMQANVDVPDDLFALPKGVEFTDLSAAELMATPLPAPASDTQPASSASR
jgi:outer membrane lipoprotein-sorting protein